MQFKDNKTLTIIFRICIFAAFFTGLMYFTRFLNLPNNDSKEKAFAGVFVMLVLAVTSVVALIKTLKGKTKPADAA